MSDQHNYRSLIVVLQAAISEQKALKGQVRELGKNWHSTKADLERQVKRTRELEDDMTGAGKLHQQATRVRRLLTFSAVS